MFKMRIGKQEPRADDLPPPPQPRSAAPASFLPAVPALFFRPRPPTHAVLFRSSTTINGSAVARWGMYSFRPHSLCMCRSGGHWQCPPPSKLAPGRAANAPPTREFPLASPDADPARCLPTTRATGRGCRGGGGGGRGRKNCAGTAGRVAPEGERRNCRKRSAENAGR